MPFQFHLTKADALNPLNIGDKTSKDKGVERNQYEVAVTTKCSSFELFLNPDNLHPKKMASALKRLLNNMHLARGDRRNLKRVGTKSEALSC